MFSEQDKAFIWGTLINEMLHAFVLFISVGSGEQSSGCDARSATFKYAADNLAAVLEFDDFSVRDVAS